MELIAATNIWDLACVVAVIGGLALIVWMVIRHVD